jgi:hypothetical protein
LWVGADVGAAVLDVGSRQFRVTGIDEPTVPGLREIVPSTSVELFVPAARVGLDVVVLADCSGSMEVDDLPVEGIRWGTNSFRTRLEALKEALLHMLQARLRVAGRESRIALIRFTSQTEQRFPSGDGMVPLDATSPPELIAEFERAISYLNVGGGTDIAGALLRAAEVLDRHGKPENDRLVVLVSDGRPWVPKTAESTGELVFAADDPVSLTAHLHDRRRIRLHAIGISNNELYEAWLRRGKPDNPGLRPDHPLLEKLVEVGGGDPTRIGGIDVLEQYFRGLGAGLTRHIGTPAAPGAPPRLSGTTLDLARQHPGDQVVTKLQSAVACLKKSTLVLNEYARRIAGRELGDSIPFKISDKVSLIYEQGELLLPARSRYEFEIVLPRLHHVIVEDGPGRKRAQGAEPPAILVPIFECFRPLVNRLNPLRHEFVHDKSSNSGRDQRDVELAVKAMRHYVQADYLDPNDAARWAKFRLGLVEDAVDAVEKALELARQAAERPDAPEPEESPSVPQDTFPADHSLEFNLRIRN